VPTLPPPSPPPSPPSPPSPPPSPPPPSPPPPLAEYEIFVPAQTSVEFTLVADNGDWLIYFSTRPALWRSGQLGHGFLGQFINGSYTAVSWFDYDETSDNIWVLSVRDDGFYILDKQNGYAQLTFRPHAVTSKLDTLDHGYHPSLDDDVSRFDPLMITVRADSLNTLSATSSDTYLGLGPADNVIDGEANSGTWNQEHCAHTANENPSWISVDLGAVVDVSHVRLVGRHGIWFEMQTTNWTIRVGNTGTASDPVCASKVGATRVGGDTYFCKDVMEGRYMSVHHNEWMVLCELTAYVLISSIPLPPVAPPPPSPPPLLPGTRSASPLNVCLHLSLHLHLHLHRRFRSQVASTGPS